MAHVVHLELKTVLEGKRCRVWMVRCRGCVAFGDQNGSVDVTIGPLGFGYYRYDLFDLLFKLGVLGHGEHGAGGFQPFVKIAVVEGRAAMPAFGKPGGNAEVLEELAVVGSLHHRPQAGNHLVATGLESVGPKTVGPMDFVEADAAD